MNKVKKALIITCCIGIMFAIQAQKSEVQSMIRLGIYQHCKGKFYRVIGVGRDVDHLQVHVIYQELHPGYGIWIRPYDQFIEETELDGKKVKRFTFIQEDVTQPPVCR